jgi:hypothetical protein
VKEYIFVHYVGFFRLQYIIVNGMERTQVLKVIGFVGHAAKFFPLAVFTVARGYYCVKDIVSLQRI